MHQIESTVDFCPRNPVLTWMLGGLNYQIEHHLFPRLPHTLYPQIAGIVRSRKGRAPRRALHVSAVALEGRSARMRATCARWADAAKPAEIEMG